MVITTSDKIRITGRVDRDRQIAQLIAGQPFLTYAHDLTDVELTSSPDRLGMHHGSWGVGQARFWPQQRRHGHLQSFGERLDGGWPCAAPAVFKVGKMRLGDAAESSQARHREPCPLSDRPQGGWIDVHGHRSQGKHRRPLSAPDGHRGRSCRHSPSWEGSSSDTGVRGSALAVFPHETTLCSPLGRPPAH